MPPLSLHSLGHSLSQHSRKSSHSSSSKPPLPEPYIPPSPSSPSVSISGSAPHRSDTLNTVSSSTGSSSSAPQSILRRPVLSDSAHSSSSNTHDRGNSTSSSSGINLLGNRISTGLSFDRTDTISSQHSDDDEVSTPSTPATSVSSLSAQCPLPPSTAAQNFPFFMMTLSSTSTLSFIALPLAMRPMVLDAINAAWRKGVSKTSQVDYAGEAIRKYKEAGKCEGGVWEVTMNQNCWLPASQDKASSRRIMINLFMAFAREGYSLTSSFRTSSKDSGKDTLIFLRGQPDPAPIFFAVAFDSSDRVWIIDAEADVGQALEDNLKHQWPEGISSARTRERHCREIKLRGNPWNAHSTASLISARCIHLFIMKSITHSSMGYDFVGSVDMADLDEGEMPVTFYRRKWGAERAVWQMKD